LLYEGIGVQKRGVYILTIREALEEILDKNEISQYLSLEDRNIIMENYSRFEEPLEKEYQFDSSKYRVAGVVLYNIVQLSDDLKNRKLADNKGLVFSIKSICKIVGIGEKAFYRLNNEFKEKFDYFNKKTQKERNNKKEKVIDENKLSNLMGIIKKYRRKSVPPHLNRETLIQIFNHTLYCLQYLYIDKSAIKIKEFLGHVMVNIYIAGYDVKEKKLTELFGEIAKDTDIMLTAGRNKEDFVRVKDIYGKYENKVYVELGGN